ncbi:MAG: glycosyltransferase family 39 protein [Candidatus Glassbacteria bacterium]|nr:glycosyltransferase family 39 protein [Candidatus Glassbacteria bacterium]
MNDQNELCPGPAVDNPGKMPVIILAALLAAHLAFTLAFFRSAISSPDANGYFKQARLIAERQRTWFSLESPLQFVAPHWLDAGDDRYFSKYPPGLPVLLAAVYGLAGPVAALLVNPWLTVLTLLGLYLLCSRWAGRWWGLFAVAVMAVNPIVNHHTLFADSHAAASCCLVWGVYLLSAWSEDFSPSKGFAAGFLLGAIPAVRYAEAVFGLGTGLFLVLFVMQNRRALKPALTIVAGAFLPLAALALRNRLAFGAFWKTGYGLSGEQTGFGLEYFMQNSVRYLSDIMGEGAGAITVLAAAGVVLMIAGRGTRLRGILLAGLIIPSTLLYMSYYFYAGAGGTAWPTLRFLLPTFYLYALAAAWFLREVSAGLRSGGRALAVAVLVLSVCWGLPQSAAALVMQERNNEPLAEITRVVEESVPAGSVVIAPRQVQQQLDYLGRWRLADEIYFGRKRLMPPVGETGRSGRPGPVSGMEERRETLEAFSGPGVSGLSKKLRAELRHWAGTDSTVYWIGDLERIRSLVGENDIIEVVAELEMPASGRMSGGMSPPGLEDPAEDQGRTVRAGGGPMMGVREMGRPFRGRFGGRDSNDARLTLVRWRVAQL